jgi:hypothetical protein
MIKQIAIADIRIDGGTQQRVVIDDTTVMQYSYAMNKKDSNFKPIELMFDGKDYWMFDGYHRFHAARKLKRTLIEANITTGTKREAVWMSLQANQKHGLRRQTGDVKAMLIQTVFPDQEWETKTDKELADWIGCTPTYISKVRKKMEEPKKPETAPKPETEQPEEEVVEPKPTVVTDELGKTVPKHLESIFNRRPEIRDHIRTVSDIFKTIKDAQQKNDMLYCNCKVDQLKADLANFRRNLRFTLPYAVCPYCGGDVNNQECQLCNSTGFINESTYLAVPAEMKG